MKIGKIFDNYQIKLICLLLSIVMWLYATRGTETVGRFMATILQGERGRITFLEVPIELVALEKQKLVSLEKRWKAEPDKISLEVKCLAAEVETSNFQVKVKLAPEELEDEEEHRITLTDKNVVLDNDGLIFVEAKPSEITIIPIP